MAASTAKALVLLTIIPCSLSLLVKETVSCGGHRADECGLCTAGHDASWCNGDCHWVADKCTTKAWYPTGEEAIQMMVKEYCFQPVRTDKGDLVNIVLVRSPFQSDNQRDLYEKYKNDFLFLGISSLEDYPLQSPNPWAAQFAANEYVGKFPGFLNMFRNASVFPQHVKTILLSQSDFSMPTAGLALPKKYDFVFSGTDQDVASDCVGWSSFAKNWTFVKQALDVMCGEHKMTGVLVASKDKSGTKACSIPKSCDGLVTQTSYLSQDDFFKYVKQSRFAFVPQVHDASPRAAAQALALDTPVLMNYNIIGGWKYINKETGEFFRDMGDFRASLKKIRAGSYSPRKHMTEHYGDAKAGRQFLNFVKRHFADKVKLPKGVQYLIPAGA